MQGSISMPTVAGFMPVFFQELRKDGQIDRAMAVARSAVAQRPDSWSMPVLTRACALGACGILRVSVVRTRNSSGDAF